MTNPLVCFATVIAMVSLPNYAAETPLVKNKEIVVTDADFLAYMERVPQGLRFEAMADGERNNKVVDLLFTNRYFAHEARKAGLDKDPVVIRRLQQQQEALLAQIYVAQLERTASIPETSEARVRELYLARAERYTEPDRIQLQHIRVGYMGRTKEMALALAKEFRARAIAGEDFLSLAKEVGEDSDLKLNEGKLGFVAAKDIDPSIAAEAFRLKADGEISIPIETRYGYHIVKRTGFQPSYRHKFGEVKDAMIEEEQARLRSEVSLKLLDGWRRNPETQWNARAIAALRTELPRAEIERKQREELQRLNERALKAVTPSNAALEVPAGKN